MPHFGLIDEKLPEVEKCLMRARLHIRGGMIRINNGEVSAGIATLFDAFTYSLYWYFLSDKMLKSLIFNENGIYKDEDTLYLILVNKNKIDGNFDLEEFNGLVEKALNNDIKEFQPNPFVQDYNDLMEQLGIIPFNESSIPKEQPTTL